MPEPTTTPTSAAPATGGDQGATGQPSSTGATATLTQDDLNRVAAKEKSEGRSAGRREALEELTQKFGVSIEDAERMIKEAKDRDEAQKTEAQKATEAANKAKAEADKIAAEAKADRHAVKVERALMAAGFQPRKDEELSAFQERLARCARLVDAEVGADDAAVTESATKVKQEFPELFAQQQPGVSRPPSGDPGAPSRPQQTPGAGDPKQRARERAIRMGLRKPETQAS